MSGENLLLLSAVLAVVLLVVQGTDTQPETETLATCTFIQPGTKAINIQSLYFVAKNVEYIPLDPSNPADKEALKQLKGGLLCPFRCTINALFVRHQRDEGSTKNGKWWAPISFRPEDKSIPIEDWECVRVMVHDIITRNTMNVCVENLKGSSQLFRSEYDATLTGICGWTNSLKCEDGSVLPEQNTFQIYVSKAGFSEAHLVTPRPQVDNFLSGCTQACMALRDTQTPLSLRGANGARLVLMEEELRVQSAVKELESDVAALLKH